MSTYATSLASSHIVRRAGLETRVAHENDGFDVVAGNGACAGDALFWVAVAAYVERISTMIPEHGGGVRTYRGQCR